MNVVLFWSHASNCCVCLLTLVIVPHVCPYGEQGSSASTAGTPSGGGTGGSVGTSLGDRVARYGRVLLVTAVVAFKIVEWWNRVEAQVRR